MAGACYCDYDPPEFYRARTVTARKPRVCGECGRHITPGDRYEYVSAKWDGYFGTAITCEACHDLRQWVQNNVPCFCWGHGNMLEEAEAAITDATYRGGEEVRGLLFGYLRKKYAVERAPRVSR